MTAENVAEHKVVLETTFLDYGSIEAKRRLRPGKAGNGLVLHSAFIEPQNGQSLGLLSQNCGIGSQRQATTRWNPNAENKDKARKKAQNRPFEQKKRLTSG